MVRVIKARVRRYFIGKAIGWGWGFWPGYLDLSGPPLYHALTIKTLSYKLKAVELVVVEEELAWRRIRL